MIKRILPALLSGTILISCNGPATKEAQLDALFDSTFKKDEPGGAVLIATDNQIIYQKGFGVADISTKEAITPNTLFNVGSISKTFVAFAILKLARENKLSLDDNVYKYFPDFRDSAIAKKVKLYHLLTHTSGLPDSRKTAEDSVFYLTAKDEENWAPIKQTDSLEFEPGEKYHYSNPAFNGLALIVEKISGMKWQEYIRSAIMEPAGMKTSTITDGPHPEKGQQVQLYQAGSGLMSHIIKAGQNGSGRTLFLNVPDRFEYRRTLYPLGYWGMLLAPVSQDLSDFVWLASPHSQPARMQTRSLTTRPLVDLEIKASPFEVNTRGVEAYDQSRLVESVLWANETYVTNYHADGNLTLQSVGEIRATPTSATDQGKPTLGQINNIATLISATVSVQPEAVTISLTWQARAPAKPTDTIFVHLVGPDGQVLAQADGDSLDGLIRPSAWQSGQIILDQRTISISETLPTHFQVRVGMYSRESGQRYPATLGTGQLAPGEALVIEQTR